MNCCEEELLQEIKKFLRHKETINLEHNLLKMLEAVPDRFPNVKKLLQIAVTSCSAERQFSAMKILKPRMRSMMSDGRLNGLALMYIHKEIDIDVQAVIYIFALAKRKCDFVLQ